VVSPSTSSLAMLLVSFVQGMEEAARLEFEQAADQHRSANGALSGMPPTYIPLQDSASAQASVGQSATCLLHTVACWQLPAGVHGNAPRLPHCFSDRRTCK